MKKELVDFVKIIYNNKSIPTIIKLIDEDHFSLAEVTGIGEVYADVTLEHLEDNSIIVFGKRVKLPAGYSPKKVFIRDLDIRPEEKYIKKDIFGREYIKGLWSSPLIIEDSISEIPAKNFNIIKRH